MSNRLKDMGETASWRVMVNAALLGAKAVGYSMKRQPGRGLSNTYQMTKNGSTKIASIRTTRDRAIAYQPLNGGKNWKTLDTADFVLVSAVTDPSDPQNIDVYLFPGDEVRKRFNASYAARIEHGHTVRDDFGMWIMIDMGDDKIVGQVGHSLAIDYPAIAHFTIDELEAGFEREPKPTPAEATENSEMEAVVDAPSLNTVAEVLTFAREKIVALTGMPADSIKLDITMGV